MNLLIHPPTASINPAPWNSLFGRWQLLSGSRNYTAFFLLLTAFPMTTTAKSHTLFWT